MKKKDTEDSLNQDRSLNTQTWLVSLYPDNESEYLEIGPGKGKKPLHILQDRFYEEQTFPYLFPAGKFGYSYERKQTLSAVRFLNYSQRFASCVDYICFAQFFEQQYSLNSSVNISARRLIGSSLNASFFNNYAETLKNCCIRSGFQGYKEHQNHSSILEKGL